MEDKGLLKKILAWIAIGATLIYMGFKKIVITKLIATLNVLFHT